MAAHLPRSEAKTEQILIGGIKQLLGPDAILDARYHFDVRKFVPDFRGSATAIDRILNLSAYQSAKTLLITPDNSLQQLRFQALKDGKRLIVGTPRLQRDFILLDPKRIAQDRLEVASLLDGMEKPGIGQPMTIAKLKDQDVVVDMFITGALAIRENGQLLLSTWSKTEVQYAIFADRGFLEAKTPVVALVHEGQIFSLGPLEAPTFGLSLTVDNIATPERLINTPAPTNHLRVSDLFIPNLVDDTPPLQELQGIKMMEDIMKSAGHNQKLSKKEPDMPKEHEQMGIDMVERLMKGYRA